MDKTFYVSEDRKVLFVLDNVSGLVTQAHAIGAEISGGGLFEKGFGAPGISPTDDSKPLKIEKKKSGRKCGLCSKVGHRSNQCESGLKREKKAKERFCARCREMKPVSDMKQGICSNCWDSNPIGKEFMFGKSFEACEAIVEKLDGVKGDDLENQVEREGLTIKQLYQMRYKVKQEWERKSDEKRFGVPINPVQSDDEPATVQPVE